MKEQYP